MRSTSRGVVAVILAVIAAGCGTGPTAAPVGRLSSVRVEHVETKTPPTDGTLLVPATGFGSRPPAWLGTRELAKTSSGYGEVLPTPPALRHRRWTLPDTVPALPGKGFAA